jgi:hypothetical protein
MRLAGDHLADALALGDLQLVALAPDPREAANHRETDLVVAEASGCRDAYAPQGWVYADVQVLDVLIDDVDVDP